MKRFLIIVFAVDLVVVAIAGGWLLLGKGRTAQEPTAAIALTDTTRVPAALRQEEIYRKADHGDLEAMYMVGEAFRLGYLVPQSSTTAMAWFRKAADNGYASAQLLLGEAYLTGTDGVPKDSKVALKWLRKAAAGDNPQAQYLLGCMYRNGENGLPKDDFAAYDLLDKAGCRDEELEKKYPQLNLVDYVESLHEVVAVPGAVQFKFYSFDSEKHRSLTPPNLTLKYSVAWPVSGCSPAALAAMRGAIATLFFNPADQECRRVPLTATELQNPRLWLELRAKRAAINVASSGSSEEDSETITFSIIYQGEEIVSGMLNPESRLTNGEYFRLMPVSFDLNTGRRLTLADIFKKGSEAALASAFRKALHRKQGISLDERLDKYDFEKDETIMPPTTFCLAGDRIFFFYKGKSVTASIPYADIVSLLRTDIPAAALWREGRAHAAMSAVIRPMIQPTRKWAFGIAKASRLKLAKITAAEKPGVIAAATKGDVNACLRLGRFYLDSGGKQNERKAAKWLRPIAKAEASSPASELAESMLEEIWGRIWKRHPEFGKAVCEDSCGSVGDELLRRGKKNAGIEACIEEAWALRGPAEAVLVRMYIDEGILDPRILAFYRESAAEGMTTSQWVYGTICFRGLGVQQDKKKAVELWKLAADKGMAPAQWTLYSYYLEEGGKEDRRNALAWFQKVAEGGNAEAQYKLGFCYANGTGVAKDEKLAVEWCRKAAGNGYAAAQYSLGACYADGTGIAKDEKLAVEWYRKAADQGMAEAQYQLGRCYLLGTGVEKNKALASMWFFQAAEQGNKDAQASLRLSELKAVQEMR